MNNPEFIRNIIISSGSNEQKERISVYFNLEKNKYTPRSINIDLDQECLDNVKAS